MKKLTSNQVRQLFLDFFKEKKHMIEPGASLIPVNDPTLLWINSGVAALKKYLDGREKPASNRIANAQKCIRTNDIENVGKTSRHHTFFEMLGNWSIGDYFKKESLMWSWEFLTSEKYIGFDPKRIYVSIYPDDIETYNIWTKDIGLDPSHILKSYDNFWQIGEGPCGPDSEIYYDRGEKYDPQGIGERLFFEEIENNRYIEIWNNVFSQYDAKDGVDRKDFKELPQKNIDTGMGLERLVCMIQDGETNFDTDLFMPYIEKVMTYTNIKYQDNKMAFRVIADHIRTCTFALSDGATFSNEGRGYVLRRVLRRAMRYARQLNISKPFMYEIVDLVCENMKDFYPYLNDRKSIVKKLILKEEESFLQTISNGEKLLNDELNKITNNTLSGEVVFKLYDTYGFPKELTLEYAQDRNINVDIDGFNSCMQKQIELARNSSKQDNSLNTQSKDLLEFNDKFDFLGYTKDSSLSKIIALFNDGQKVDSLDTKGAIVFDSSPFYAESGGQIADRGYIYNENQKIEVIDVKKAPNGQFLHYVDNLNSEIKVGDIFNLEINVEERNLIRANHSGIHLLQSALKKILGNHIAQAGSFVCKNYSRFDFSHFEKISNEKLIEIENQVNEYIFRSLPITTEVLNIEDAKKTNAIALFDEKYSDFVRVVSMGDVSKEFCGGTHAFNTSDLNLFKIVSEESIGSGIRRIEFVTKYKALEYVNNYQNQATELMNILKLKNSNQNIEKVYNLLEENQELSRQLKSKNEKLLSLEIDSKLSFKQDIKGKSYLALILNDLEFDLKQYGQLIIAKNIDIAVVLNKSLDKLSFIALCKQQLSKSIDFKQISKDLSSSFNLKGGGKPDLIMGTLDLNTDTKKFIQYITSEIENKL